jgi:flagellar motility protein MotE (MotC chaperone)
LEKQKEFLGCIDTLKAEEDKRVTQMVEIISTMKADKAAQVLSIQDQELTIKILGLLDSRMVSKIFNLMDKEISARLQKQFMTMKR